MKNFFAFLTLAVVSLVLIQMSHPFDLGGLLESMAKPPPKSPPAKQQASPQQQPAEQSDEGLLGLGESLGIFDKKTSRILKKSVGAVQAFQPIGLKEEKTIGGSLALEVFHRFGGMYKSPALQNYVSLVGKSVAEVSDRPEIDYHFAVLNTDNANAFATPGGYVFVSVGLLRMVQNEAQLAGVLGHEIAHITNKHALQTLKRSKMLSGLSGLTMAAMDQDEGLFDKVINEVSNILFTHGLDKDLEFEADEFGTEYAYRMGYHPAGLKDFIQILGKSGSSKSSIFLSTHPGPAERFQGLNQILPQYKGVGLYPILARRYQARIKGQL